MENNDLDIFIKMLNVKHTKSFTNKYITEHPHKYDMYGLSSILSVYGIDNKGLKLGNKDDIYSIEPPFIAHTKDDFVVVEEVKQNIRYIQRGKAITIPFEEFKKIWTGNLLLAETNEFSIEPNYKKNLFKERILSFQKFFLLAALVFLIAIPLFQNVTSSNTILLVLNLVGAYIGYLLILKQLHVQSSYADKLCSLFRHNDCNNILESDAAKLFGILGWSEVGLGYFISNIFIISVLPGLIPVISIINILTLPYSFWSVWYQKFKAKQWCPLCLTVLMLLWAIFATNLVFGAIQFSTIVLSELIVALCIYSVFVLGANILIPIIGQNLKTENLNYEINSIKANEDVFIALLKQQPYYNVTKETSCILFGNIYSDNVVTVFSNPHCDPCAKMHKRINELLKYNKNICIQYIFSSFGKDLDVSNKFLIAAFKQEGLQVDEIYNEWFEKRGLDKEEFFKTYQVNITSPDVLDEFDRHERWKEISGLRATPTILVNGYKLPNNFKIEDIAYL